MKRKIILTLTCLLAGCAQDTRPSVVIGVPVDGGAQPDHDHSELTRYLLDAGLVAEPDAELPPEEPDAELPDFPPDDDDWDAGSEPQAPDPVVDAGRATKVADTCEACSSQDGCDDDHFCWEIADSNRCLPLATAYRCEDIGMDGRSLPDGTIFCRPLTGDCDQWLLLTQ